MVESRKPHLAVFLATSGHSGVDRIMNNLLPSVAARGIIVDLLHVKNHGPFIQTAHPNLRIVELGSAHSYSSLLPLVRYLKRQRPDVLLSDKDRVNRVALVATRLAGIPISVFVRMGTTVSENLANRKWLDRSVQRMSMRYLYPLADGVLTPSEGAADDLSRYAGLPRNRIFVVPSPIVTETLFDKASEITSHPWFTDKSKPVIVGIGELSERKDFTTLISAFAELRKIHEARLFIMGEGKKRKELEKLVTDQGLDNDIELSGFIGNPYPYLARADLYVHSSRWEGSPVALMEAVALGIPTVSTDCPNGPREILQNGKYGRLTPVGDHRSMTQAMLDTLCNPPDPAVVREAAESYSLDESTSRYIEVLGLTEASS